jgi:hypothetical protein
LRIFMGMSGALRGRENAIVRTLVATLHPGTKADV